MPVQPDIQLDMATNTVVTAKFRPAVRGVTCGAPPEASANANAEDQKLEALADDAMGFLAFDVGDKAHAARVMLMPRIVKSLFWRQTHRQTPNFRCSAHPNPPIPFKTREKRAPHCFLHTCAPGTSCNAA